MTLLHPAILAAGLLAVAIPIAIHFLMRRRRKPVPWAAMRFLIEAYRKKRRRLRLEQLLLLAARCLLLALAGLALARPMLGAGRLGAAPRTLVVLLDNSLTAQVTAPDGTTALDRHKALAERAILALDVARGDRAAIVTLAQPASALVAAPSADLGAVARAIEGVEPTDARADLPGAAALARAAFEAAEGAEPVLLLASDLLAGSAPVDTPLPETGIAARLLAPQPAPARPNTAILALDPSRRVVAPDEPAGRLIVARLARYGPESAGRTNLRVTDERTGRVLGEASVAWEPGQRERSVSVPIAGSALAGAGGAGGSVSVLARIDADALPGDDARRSVLEMRSAVRVGIVARGVGSSTGEIGRYTPADWVRLALQPEAEGGAIDLVALEPVRVDPPTLSRLDAAIVLAPDDLADAGWSALATFADAGGLIMVTPPAGAVTHLWADALAEHLAAPWAIEARAAEAEASLAIDPASTDPAGLLGLIDAELEYLAPPVGVQRWVRIGPSSAGQRLEGVQLRLADATPWIVTARPGQGRGLLVLIASAIDPAWTDLPAKPLIVPLLQEIIRQGVGRARAGSGAEAGQHALAPRGAVELVDALSDARAGALVLDASGVTTEPVRTAGAWAALDAGGSSRGLVVVNPAAPASDTSARTPEELAEWLAPLAAGGAVEWISADEAPEPGAARTVTTALGADRDGLSIGWLILAGVLALAVAELALARLCSHATGGQA